MILLFLFIISVF